MEAQLGSLANLLSKLMVKARTTTNSMYYEVLNAQIVKLQYQMTQLSLNLEAEKARAAVDGQQQANSPGKPKVGPKCQGVAGAGGTLTGSWAFTPYTFVCGSNI